MTANPMRSDPALADDTPPLAACPACGERPVGSARFCGGASNISILHGGWPTGESRSPSALLRTRQAAASVLPWVQSAIRQGTLRDAS